MEERKQLRKLHLFFDWEGTLGLPRNNKNTIVRLRKFLQEQGFDPIFYVSTTIKKDAIEEGLIAKGLKDEIAKVFDIQDIFDGKNFKKELQISECDVSLLIDNMFFNPQNHVTNSPLRAKLGSILGINRYSITHRHYQRYAIRYDEHRRLHRYGPLIAEMAERQISACLAEKRINRLFSKFKKTLFPRRTSRRKGSLLNSKFI